MNPISETLQQSIDHDLVLVKLMMSTNQSWVETEVEWRMRTFTKSNRVKNEDFHQIKAFKAEKNSWDLRRKDFLKQQRLTNCESNNAPLFLWQIKQSEELQKAMKNCESNNASRNHSWKRSTSWNHSIYIHPSIHPSIQVFRCPSIDFHQHAIPLG